MNSSKPGQTWAKAGFATKPISEKALVVPGHLGAEVGTYIVETGVRYEGETKSGS